MASRILPVASWRESSLHSVTTKLHKGFEYCACGVGSHASNLSQPSFVMAASTLLVASCCVRSPASILLSPNSLIVSRTLPVAFSKETSLHFLSTELHDGVMYLASAIVQGVQPWFSHYRAVRQLPVPRQWHSLGSLSSILLSVSSVMASSTLPAAFCRESSLHFLSTELCGSFKYLASVVVRSSTSRLSLQSLQWLQVHHQWHFAERQLQSLAKLYNHFRYSHY